MRIPVSAVALTFLLLAGSGKMTAHSLYILPSEFQAHGDAPLVFSIHNGDSFPASEEAADPQRITDAETVCEQADRHPITDFKKLGTAIHGAAQVSGDGSCWITVSTLPRQFEMEPNQFEAYLAEEGLEAVIQWRKAHGETTVPGT